jgi:hypothetical protein
VAEKEYPPLVMPAGVERRTVTVWSDGLALDADLYRPSDLTADRPLPAVVLGHGWGGSKVTAERYAALFAADGMVTLTFTQATWFGSAARLQQIGPIGDLADGTGRVEVREIRDLVDPFAWIAGTRSALDFLEGEPGVDPDRIGLWATSFGGGVAVHQTAHDPRVKALVVQVPALTGLRSDLARARAIATARGEAPALPQGVDPWGSMSGTPFLAHFAHYDPLSEIDQVRVPTLIMDAGNEDLFATEDNGGAAAAALERNGIPVEYLVIPGIDHYGIYFDGYETGSERARAWWERHL